MKIFYLNYTNKKKTTLYNYDLKDDDIKFYQKYFFF
jgi:hypothetical protein